MKEIQSLIDIKNLHRAGQEILKLNPNELTITEEAKVYYEQELSRIKRVLQD